MKLDENKLIKILGIIALVIEAIKTLIDKLSVEDERK